MNILSVIDVVPKREDKPLSYPYLGRNQRSKNSGFIVLFVSDRQGTVVWSNCADYSVGDYSTGWAMDAFAPYYGSLTIRSRED